MMRFFTAGLCALALTVPSNNGMAAAPLARQQAPGYYRLQLGAFEVTALSDGTRPLNAHMLVNLGPAEIDQALARRRQSSPVETSFNGFLVNTGGKLLLVDSGAGEFWGARLGQLENALRAAGYTPEQVDEVYLTHMHTDHVGGLLKAGAARFPNAVVRASQAEADYWLSAANLERAAPDDRGSFRNAVAALAPYVAARRFLPFAAGAMLAPGVRALPSAGHTAGHSAYLVESQGQRLLLWGDTLHVAAVQFDYPDATMRFDFDRAAAVAARRLGYATAAREGYLVAGAHLPFPGLGYTGGDASAGYSWIPLNYSRAD
jgi:glyoxylase-like metal-dependent hydrolase (beta-lactamase superfamily II)